MIALVDTFLKRNAEFFGHKSVAPVFFGGKKTLDLQIPPEEVYVWYVFGGPSTFSVSVFGCLGKKMLHLPWKSKTKQRMVFWMIHVKDSLLPMGKVWSTWTSCVFRNKLQEHGISFENISTVADFEGFIDTASRQICPKEAIRLKHCCHITACREAEIGAARRSL